MADDRENQIGGHPEHSSLRFTYVEMRCLMDRQPAEVVFPHDSLIVESLEEYQPGDLFACYTAAFSAGDAQFYHFQTATDQKLYFDQELGFPVVLSHPASFVCLVGTEVIAFTLVLTFPENNYHIACMCVLPDYQDRGLGRAMLNRVKNIAFNNGIRSITLGTEPTMKAFQLYSENGFSVTDEHLVEIPDPHPGFEVP